MNTKRDTTSGTKSTATRFRPWIWRALLTFLAALALGLIVPARAGTQPAAIPFSDIGARATADYLGAALGVTATAEGARLRCGFQKLEGHATPEGLWLESTKPGAAGKLRLTAAAICRAGLSTLHPPQFCYGGRVNPQPSTRLAATGTVSVQDKLVRFTRPGLTEEYSVSVDGVRQDFVIESPPLNPQRSTLNQSAGDLRVELALSGARAEAAAGGVRLRLEGSARVLAYSRLRVEDAAGRDLPARLELLAADRVAVSVADANATYPVRIDPTFSDADWVSLNPGIAGANSEVLALAVDDSGNVYAGGHFTFIGTVPANYIAKWDGSTWSALGSGLGNSAPHSSPGVFALAVSGTDLYAGGYFTTAGGVAATNIAKWNGSAWSALGTGMDYGVSALAVNGTALYAGGDFTTAGGVPLNYIAKWNGSYWSGVGSGMNGSVSALIVSGTDLYAAGYFTAAGGAPAPSVAKWNGSTWSGVGSGPDHDSGPNGGVAALAVMGTDLYAGGGFTTAAGVTVNHIAKWDGTAWSALSAGMDGGVSALAVSGTDLYAGGGFTTAGGVPANFIAKWDGSAWSALGSGVVPGVFALAVSGTDLYAGGSFNTAGGVGARAIAKWDGSAWSALGSGMDDGVDALAVNGASLYAGGGFTTAGGLTANYIAKWDGSAWSALGSGMNYAGVAALAVNGTGLYAGGNFTTAGEVTANGIAKWDGSTWSALGSGMGGFYPNVYALAVSGTNLFAGGGFTTADGVTANGIAKWDGSAWSALGSGMGGASPPIVYALAMSGTNLYAGGAFTTAGGVPANCIAKWNGSTWSALGSGMTFGGLVRSLAVSGTNLYAGGQFTTAGGVPANYIAKWDGGAWSALGSGIGSGGPVGPYVRALAVSGTDLYVGGVFTNASGMPANSIAKWDGSAWSALGSGMGGASPPDVYALAVDGAGHLFVGGYFSLAGATVSPYIAQANLNGQISAAGGRFGSLSYSPAAGFTCTFSDASAGQPYRIQTSPSLAIGSWTDFTNFTYTGPIVITDTATVAETNRFYRAVTP